VIVGTWQTRAVTGCASRKPVVGHAANAGLHPPDGLRQNSPTVRRK
jgi:hypothetical protein